MDRETLKPIINGIWMKIRKMPNRKVFRNWEIILWEVKSFPAVEINKREEEINNPEIKEKILEIQ